MQSWGERARWSIRDTAPEPTKSGVVGLLGCALGWADDESLRRLSMAIHMGVRCDRPGLRMVDYHTIVGGVMAAEGKIKINANTKEPETVVTERAYLFDASFLVVIQSQETWIDRLSSAIQSPVWPVYLGRKSCPPSLPVYEGVGEFSTIDKAMKDHPIRAISPGPISARCILECPPGEGKLHSDELVSNSRRTFQTRQVIETIFELTALPKEV